MTPATCWKTPCTPQKQPPASTATSDVAEPTASSVTGAGTARACAAGAMASARPANPASIVIRSSIVDLRRSGQIAALAPIALGAAVKRQVERAFLAVLAQLLERQRLAVAVFPGNRRAARIHRRAEFVDHLLGRAFEAKDGPAAEIDRPDIGAEAGIFLIGDRGAHQPIGFERLELRLVDRQEFHAQFDRLGGDTRQRLVPNGVELAARHGAEAIRPIGHALGIDDLAAPALDIVE